MPRKPKQLERIEASKDDPFAGMSESELLLNGSDGAKNEVFRRRFNKLVKKQA